MPNRNWTREETIIAFNVYCKIPFKSSSKSNPVIIKYAEIIGRSPSALNMKIGNFGRLDPELRKQGIGGLKHGSKIEEDVWDEFHGNWEKLAYESEALISTYSNSPIEKMAEVDIENFKEGTDRESLVKQRVNQHFFRDAVLSSYNFKCCITGLPIPEILIASHIIPWSKNHKHRLNPRNGLCLNSIHDKAYDRGFITITPDYKIRISNALLEHRNDKSVNDFFIKYNEQKIILPNRFVPSRKFLDYHNQNIFIK